MTQDRMARINKRLQTTLARMMPRVVKDPWVAGGLVAVSEVRATPDLATAKVFVAVGGDDDARAQAMAGLDRARKHLRGELGKRLRLRRIPELHFVLDTTGDQAAHIEKILGELDAERAANDAAPQAAMVHISLERVAQLLDEAERVLIASHRNPDGDAIGSTLGIYQALRGLGKTVTPYNPDPVPEAFRFLPGAHDVVQDIGETPFDLTLVLDCSDDRIFADGAPPIDRALLGTVVVVDHHKTLGDIGDYVYCDASAAAVGLLMHRLLRELKVELTYDIAEPLYTSLMSDTGSFRYQNTNPEAMRVGADLLEHGVDPWRIASNLYESRPPSQLKLLARVLGTLSVSDDGKAAALTVTEEMLDETGCTDDMVDGFVNFARGVSGVEVAMLLRPRGGAVRLSMRSRGNIDVSAVAERFGGGGHKNAAGATVPDTSVERLRSQLFAAVTALIAAA
ncbi:MAG: 30S ribosome-binding factor RbfA [Myxococcales bacterium]|nr:30S ribosome-binding factor RbfA [Myxococcales bacterium]